jgi:hypothetical protein
VRKVFQRESAEVVAKDRCSVAQSVNATGSSKAAQWDTNSAARWASMVTRKAEWRGARKDASGVEKWARNWEVPWAG